MKRVLLISVAVTLVALTGCIYSPATYEPTVEEQATMEVFANDSTVTLDTVQCIVLEKINPDWKQMYIDTLDNFLSLPLAGGTVQDTLGHAAVVPGSADKYRIEVDGSYLGAYAKLDVPANAQYDIYLDIHGTVTVWDGSGRIVEYDSYGMSTACAMIFKGDTRNSLIREHYTYELDAGDYYIRFKKAENAAYKSKNYFFGIIN